MNAREQEQDVQDACTVSASDGGRWLRGTSLIADNRALLGHDAERYDPNSTMMASKQAGKPELIYFTNKIEAHVKITSIIIKINFYIIYKRQSRIAARGNVFRRLFRPIRANSHALADRVQVMPYR